MRQIVWIDSLYLEMGMKRVQKNTDSKRQFVHFYKHATEIIEFEISPKCQTKDFLLYGIT